MYTQAKAAELLEMSERSLRRMAMHGKPARFYRARSGNRDEVVYDAEEIDGMRRSSPAQVDPPARQAPPPPPPPSGQTMLLAALSRLLERVSAPALLPPPPPRDWLTPAEAADLEGLSEAFIRRAIRAGHLRVVRDGHAYKVHRAGLASLAGLARLTTELRDAVSQRRGAVNAR